VRIPVALVGVGEVLPDVPETRSAEQSVDDRVGQNVGVGMANESAVMLDLDAAKNESAILCEAMTVVTNSCERLPHGPVTRSPRLRAPRR
jgi:hypothetical protein